MPYLKRVKGNTWLLLAHEQWENSGSRLPSRIGLKLYYNESDLFTGTHFNSFEAPLSVGRHSQLEGTPNIYSATAQLRSGYWVVDALLGFHFNDDKGVDQVAHATLQTFGPTVLQPTWSAQPATRYNVLFIKAGAIGNIGQREMGTLGNTRFIVQEGNIGHMPPTIWQDWRIWIYWYSASEGIVPNGSGRVQMLSPKTPGGSTAFGNPSFSIVKCPNDPLNKCLFVSYFLFGEGAAPGEGGSCIFFSPLNSTEIELR